MTSRFVWYELMTTDPAAATLFYGKVLGWTASDSGLASHSYSILSTAGLSTTGLSTAGAPFGGLMAIPAEAARGGAKPGWMGYLGVADVDALARRVTAAGGVVQHAPADIPEVGRFAVVADPQGAHFALFKGGSEEEFPAPSPETPGSPCWNELHTTDWERAFPFYADLFGWTKAESHDMGPAGVYQLFAIDGAAAGGMLNEKDPASHPFWLFYFAVAEINAAVARVATEGGKVLAGPHEVPGGGRIIHCADPQGAAFALVAPPHTS
ncbi:MAG: VOC family protein [Acetobacteraceae bacterium]